MMPIKPLLLLVSAFTALPVAAGTPQTPASKDAKETPPTARKSLVLGTFTVANPGGSLIADYKDSKRPVYALQGPKLTLRSKSLDVDARSVRMVLAGRVVVDGVAEGPVRIVVRQDGNVETIHCDKATWLAPPTGAEGQLLLVGSVRWLHSGPDVDGPAEMTGNKAVVTLRKGGAGPLIELDNGSLTATPKEKPKPVPGKPSAPVKPGPVDAPAIPGERGPR